jgi:hypothetical protein
LKIFLSTIEIRDIKEIHDQFIYLFIEVSLNNFMFGIEVMISNIREISSSELHKSFQETKLDI